MKFYKYYKCKKEMKNVEKNYQRIWINSSERILVFLTAWEMFSIYLALLNKDQFNPVLSATFLNE